MWLSTPTELYAYCYDFSHIIFVITLQQIFQLGACVAVGGQAHLKCSVHKKLS